MSSCDDGFCKGIFHLKGKGWRDSASLICDGEDVFSVKADIPKQITGGEDCSIQ